MVFLYVSWVTDLVKVDISLTFRHTAQRFPWQLHKPVTLSIGYNLTLTKSLLSFLLLLQNVTIGSGIKTYLVFSSMYKMFKCLWIKLWKDFNKGWYETINVTRSDLLYLVLLFSLLNRTLLIFFWSKCLG